MNCRGSLLSAILLLSCAHNVGAQIPGAICADGMQARGSLAYPPEDLETRVNVWTNALKIKLHPDLTSLVRPVDESVLDSLSAFVSEDSLGVVWALARLTVDPRFANDLEASVAGGAYRYLSGEAVPILFYLRESNLHPRIQMGFGAIRGPVTSVNERIILGFSCEAAWLLKAAANDSLYQRGIVALPMLTDARLIMWDAYSILSHEGRALIRQLIVATEASSGGDFVNHVKEDSTQ